MVGQTLRSWVLDFAWDGEQLSGRSGEPCCPCCTKVSAGYDTRRRVFRHLDTCQYKTHLIVDVPRIESEGHGVMQVDISWAECNSLFTALFKCMVIECLKEANFSVVARRMKLSWNEVDGIINAIVLKATNALGKSMNATIQKIKSQAYGYRNRQRFSDASMFRFGGLDLYPGTASTHTDS